MRAGGKIGRGSDRPERKERKERRDRRGAKGKGAAERRVERPVVAESENPLAKRRNPDALKSIKGRTPQLAPQEGPMMRSRGWRRKPSSDNTPQE